METVSRLVAVTLGLLLATAALPGAESPQQTALGRISYSQDLPVAMDKGLSLPLANGVLRRKVGAHVVVIEGRDFDDKPWRVRMPTVEETGGSMAFMADLDGDPLSDFFVLHSYGSSGMCVGLGLSAILFDQQGRPTPWYAQADFDGRNWWKEGIRDWEDWDGDGGVELILPECYNYEYNTATSPYPQGAFGLQDVYEAHHGYWRKLGTDERKPFESLYLDVLVRGDRPIAPRPEKGFTPQPPDLSNDPSQGRKIKSFRVVRGEEGPPRDVKYKSLELRRKLEHHIEIDTEESCYGAPMVVVDREVGREVLFDGRSDHTWNVLTEISDGEFDVVLTGQNEEEICSPTVVWAYHR